jgi:formylglycine-generating enzyme required for sulfatase activity
MIYRFLAVASVIVLAMPANSFAQQEAGKERKAGEVIENSIGMKLAYIPPGEFMMGSPKSERQEVKKAIGNLDWAEQEVEHKVKISKGFYLGVHTVTQEEYEKLMGQNPSHFSTAGKGKNAVAGLDTKRFPVERVTWEEAKEFCKKLSAKEGKTYRLPTEAEWEYACRAGTTTPFHFGATISTDQANFYGEVMSVFTDDKKKSEFRDRTTEVGKFPANAWGLRDMHGNVSQWCEDWHDVGYYGKSPETDPLNTTKGASRVARGGYWRLGAPFCRSAYRRNIVPEHRHNDLGFRVARSAE